MDGLLGKKQVYALKVMDKTTLRKTRAFSNALQSLKKKYLYGSYYNPPFWSMSEVIDDEEHHH